MAYGAKLWSACSLLPLLPQPARWLGLAIAGKECEYQIEVAVEIPASKLAGRESGSKLHALQSFAP